MQRMFENMIDPLIERCRPHALTIRDECRMFAGSVIERLDRIAEVSADDGPAFARFGYPANYADNHANIAGVPTAVLWEVPRGEEWELEVISARGTQAGTFLLYRNNIEVMSFSTTPGGRVPLNGNGVRFLSGDTVGYEVASGVATTGQVYAQFRVERPRTPRRVNQSAGFRNPAPDRTDGGQEVEDTRRHVGSWHPGVPVMGPSAPR
jgi:hypothetical protein